MIKKVFPLPGGQSRPPLERMQRLHDLLMNERPVNCQQLAREFEVSYKTIQRDLDFMRDRLNLPIEYDATKYTFRYSEPVESFPLLQVSEGEILALFVAQKVLAQYRGTPFERTLASAFQKLTGALKEEVSFNLGEWGADYSFRVTGASAADLEIFRLLAKAIVQRQEVTFSYRSLRAATPETRVVHPYHLSNVDNAWYLLAHDRERGQIRTFALARIRGPKATGKTFDRPRNFSAEKELKSGFGVFGGSGKHKVRIRFDAFAARLVRERDWHPSQKITELRAGEIQLEMTLGALEEIERWILSWGEHARVIEPKILADSLRQRILKTIKQYR
ncbi:MAG: WYL domain-containing transcriptional regulator [Verrucomicrobia bacterium]|nr:WYL domain-containing transcriptional regulator [Verrucomicrobiota bacterium]